MPQPESIAGAIFSSDRTEILLVQRRDVPVWVLPGGGIDPGESPQEAVIREVWEETGFQVIVQRLVGVYTPINRLARHTHLYECTIVAGAPKVSSETQNVQFFRLDALPKLMPPPYREWIEEAEREGPLIERALTSVNYGLFVNLLFHPILSIRFLLAKMGWAIHSK